MVLCPHGDLEVNCPICFPAKRKQTPLENLAPVPLKDFAPAPNLGKRMEMKTLDESLRSSGILAFQHAPAPLSRDSTTFGVLGGTIDGQSESKGKNRRELSQLNDLREITRLKIPHKEIRKNL